ncbi:MAG: protoheme IX farnesyltransferase [Chthoniobacterales bacterium]|nr:protoheme IX farnesyltransferase [Chthoniobacterales bacterium]
MKSVAIETASAVDPLPLEKRGAGSRMLVDFAELTKARLTLLVLVTTAVGYYLGAEAVRFGALFHAVFGTALAAAGAAALNQWWEHRFDALMHRTRMRPIPAGRMLPRNALVVGSCLGVAGVVYLALACNLLSAGLAAVTIAVYIFGYTPLKRVSTTNTLVGAIPGALPPMIGWAAARNDLTWPAWSLFAILFCWQMPHFFAIAWMYREDYARAGFRMLSSSDLDGARSGRQSVFFAALLSVASVLPAFFGLSSRTFVPLELLLSAGFLALALRFYAKRGVSEARWLFIGSILYLPLLLATLVLTKS